MNDNASSKPAGVSTAASPSDSDRLAELTRAIGDGLLSDQPAFARQAAALKKRLARGVPIDKGLSRLRLALHESTSVVDSRRAAPVRIDYPIALPVSARQEEIAAAVKTCQVVILCGETGSGKTTQLPKLCLEMGRGLHGRIGHTQPRRMAARAAAARIAEETDTILGDIIGYQVRFDDRTVPATRLKVMTDGILLSEIHGDPLLTQYDTLIIDEAHERSLNIDFLLGYLHRILPRRPDLRVIVTSATLDPERLSRHFNDAPVLKVEGRAFPVEVRYRPIDNDEDTPDAIARVVGSLLQGGDRQSGDVLVFLPGERDIRETARVLEKRAGLNAEVMPLLARLSAREQDRVFKPGKRRRIILATNIAETSLTVPRIRYVIDTGTARIKRYNAKSRIEQLAIEPVSRASANQRMGRCGRLQNGICVRLYDEAELDERAEFTDPEILRSNLASVILQMSILGLGAIEQFAFVDRPSARYVRDGFRLLRELEAVDDAGNVTAIGKRMARLPVDPQFARIVLAAPDSGCLREVLTIVAGLSVQDPRERPMDAQGAADESHAAWQDERSDFVSLLNLWRDWKAQRKSGSSAVRRWCREQFLNQQRLREWGDVRRQLKERSREMKLAMADAEADYGAIHKAVLKGLLGHIGLHEDSGQYQGARGTRFRIFPGSGLARKRPRWVVCSELVLTSRLYGRTVAQVQPAWIEKAAAHLVKSTVREPAWSRSSGEVEAVETIALYGLVLVPRRRIRYASVDRAAARDIFIDQALVTLSLELNAPFNGHNRKIIGEVRALEARLRRPAPLDEERIRAFFDGALPADVAGVGGLRRWLKKDRAANNAALSLKPSHLGELPETPASDFPDDLQWRGNTLALTYRFAPERADDGATLEIPAALLLEVPAALTEWGIPAWLPDKVVSAIRQLPKPVRRCFVPVPDTAARFLDSADVQERRAQGGGLFATLAAWLSQQADVVVTPEMLAGAQLPLHQQLNLSVVGDDGAILAAGRDLAALKTQCADKVLEARSDDEDQSGRFLSWDFGPLESSVQTTSGELTLTRYPALVDCADSVRLVMQDNEAQARRDTVDGIIRLYRLRFPQEARFIARRLLPQHEAGLAATRMGGLQQMSEDLVWRAFRDVFLPADGPPVTDAESFERRAGELTGRIVPHAQVLSELVMSILRAAQALRTSLADANDSAQLPGIADVLAQVDRLLAPGFLRSTPPGWLEAYPRYLRAAARRLEQMPGKQEQDVRSMERVAAWWERWERIDNSAGGRRAGDVEHLRWMIEEYRVSLFAQAFGTRFPVSARRLERLAEALER